MKIVHSVREWRQLQTEDSLGFVPTMGALHEGHMSLVDSSLKENNCTAVSIYLNPTQFNNQSDLSGYPVTWDADIEKLEKAGVHYLFAPDYSEIYPDDYTYVITEKSFSTSLCGKSRPGHFDGVLTVVMKLLQIIRPAKAYFGEKDYQQLSLIRGMCSAFFLPIEIVACPIIREPSGLAMSSRNARLSDKARMDTAPELYRIISSGKKTEEMKKALVSAGFKPDYIEIHEKRLFAAAFLEDVRLIDNVPF